jgi:hypothetical protein
VRQLQHRVLHDVKGIRFVTQCDLCDPESLALDSGQKGLEGSRAVLGAVTQMGLSGAAEFSAFRRKSSKGEHTAAPAATDGSSRVHNGAGPGPVDRHRRSTEGPANHPLTRRKAGGRGAFRGEAGGKSPLFNRNYMINMELPCCSFFHQTDMKALKHR